jgi:hypothetical protein
VSDRYRQARLALHVAGRTRRAAVANARVPKRDRGTSRPCSRSATSRGRGAPGRAADRSARTSFSSAPASPAASRARATRRSIPGSGAADDGSDVGHVGKVPPRGRPRGACQSLVTLANARPSQVATMMLVPAAFAGTTLSSASSSRALSIVRVARGALMSGAGGSEPPCRTCYTKHHSPTRVFQGLVLLKRMSCCSSATAASCGAVVRTTRIRSPNRSRIWRVAAATLEAVRHVSRVHAQRESACESKVEEPHDHPLVPLHPVVLLHLGNPA